MLTFVVVLFLIHLVTAPLLGLMQAIFAHHGFFSQPFLFLSPEEVRLWVSRLVILCSLVAITFLVGFFGRLFLIRWLGRIGDELLHRIPFVNKIYKPIQEAVHTIFTPKEKTVFSTVVLVPFPYQGSYCLGLVTRSGDQMRVEAEHADYLSVFVPGTPNPAMGFMLLYHKNHVIPLTLTVEDAMKFVISCGVILPNPILHESYEHATEK